MKAFFITGKPACGKDTQADFLAKRFKLTKIVTSKLIRDFFSRNKQRQLKLGGTIINLDRQRRLYQSGGLVAASLVSYLIGKKIRSLAKKKSTSVVVAGASFVLAGSPRKLAEAKAELKILDSLLGAGNYFFIYLKISDREAIHRAIFRPYTDKRRSDNLDALPIVKERLKAFRQDVVPALRYLKQKGKLIEINGEQPTKKVFEEILRKIRG